MLRVLGNYYIAPWYGGIISIVFGFLLLSATNTAISDLVSIQFLMAKDREFPRAFSRLNRYGMPALALIIAVAIPSFVLILEHDLVHLAALYAIGVVGAITLNLGSCATNFQLKLKPHERILLFVGTIILFFIEITIAFQKHHALIFALTVMGTGLALRFIAKVVAPPPVPILVEGVNVLTVSEAKELALLYKGSTLVALKSLNPILLDEAVLHAKALNENSVYLSYVEESPATLDVPQEIEPSEESLELLGRAQKEIENRGLTAIPVWQIGQNPGKLVAVAAHELDVKTVIIGTTKRSALTTMVRGDVLRTLARRLPRQCRLIISG
jgi:nucleotide-binding universal stress UspA family protein